MFIILTHECYNFLITCSLLLLSFLAEIMQFAMSIKSADLINLFSKLNFQTKFPRVDKWYGDWWSHLCPKKWLIYSKWGQGLSQKVGFFLIFEPILWAGFFDKMLALSNKKFTFILVSGCCISIILFKYYLKCHIFTKRHLKLP